MHYYTKTFGCQMNFSDSERIAGFLAMHKIKPTRDILKADLVVFNTCGVRQTAENSAMSQIHNLRRKSKKIKTIVLTGCLAKRKDVQKKLEDKVDLFCEIKNFPREFSKILNVDHKLNCAYLKISPDYANHSKASVPVMTGCNNFCSYCVVPYARGKETSRPAEDIYFEIKKLAKNNYKEIVLLGQNVNSYQFINNNSSADKMDTITFPKLLDNLAKKFPKINFSFLTSHPKDFSEELMKVITENKNINKEIHLPIQAGSDKILKAMNRPYTQKHYLNLIKKAQEIIPQVSFTTDVIVGFPGESEKDFQKTVDVFKKVKYNEAYINKYSPRPGTAAFKLNDPITWEEKKRREKILRKLIKHKK